MMARSIPAGHCCAVLLLLPCHAPGTADGGGRALMEPARRCCRKILHPLWGGRCCQRDLLLSHWGSTSSSSSSCWSWTAPVLGLLVRLHLAGSEDQGEPQAWELGHGRSRDDGCAGKPPPQAYDPVDCRPLAGSLGRVHSGAHILRAAVGTAAAGWRPSGSRKGGMRLGVLGPSCGALALVRRLVWRLPAPQGFRPGGRLLLVLLLSAGWGCG